MLHSFNSNCGKLAISKISTKNVYIKNILSSFTTNSFTQTRGNNSNNGIDLKKEAKPLPTTVKGFLTRPGHEVTTLLKELTPKELDTKVGPEYNDDVLFYHKLISNTDISNVTLKLIRQFENKMLGINRQQLENRPILNDTFNAFLKRKQYVKYFLLLRRIENLKNRIVPLNMILQHYITELKDLDGARRIYLKFTKLGGQLPNDATLTILFKAYNIQFSRKSKFAVSLDSRNETFYKNIIMKLLFEKNSFCKEIRDYDIVVNNAFRFSCYRLPLQFSLQLLEKLKRNEDLDSNNENLLYLDSVNMFWRGMGIKSLYYNRFDRETREDLYNQANKEIEEEDTEIEEMDSKDIDPILFGEIDNTTGSFKYTDPQSTELTAETKKQKRHPDYSLLLNFNKFKEFLNLFVEKQKKVSEMGIHEIITMLNSRANVITNSLEERHYFQNLIFNMVNNHIKPMTPEFEKLIQNKIDKTIPFEWKLETLKKKKINNMNDTKYLMNSHTFEQLIKLSSDIKDEPLFQEIYSILKNPDNQFKKLQKDYNYAKWLLSLNKFYPTITTNNNNSSTINKYDGIRQLNEKRREALTEILPLVCNDIDSMLKFYHMTIPKWFNDQCLAGDITKENLSKELQKVTTVFIKFVELKDLKFSKEEVIMLCKTTFKEYVKRYQM